MKKIKHYRLNTFKERLSIFLLKRTTCSGLLGCTFAYMVGRVLRQIQLILYVTMFQKHIHLMLKTTIDSSL